MDDLLGCAHKHRSFVQSGNGMGGRHSIHVCEDCGKLLISMSKDGVYFSLNFHINDPAQLDMMRKWADYVWVGYDLETSETSK